MRIDYQFFLSGQGKPAECGSGVFRFTHCINYNIYSIKQSLRGLLQIGRTGRPHRGGGADELNGAVGEADPVEEAVRGAVMGDDTVERCFYAKKYNITWIEIT